MALYARVFPVAVCLFFSLHVFAQAPVPAATSGATSVPLQRVATGVEALQRWYVMRTGLYQTTGWWNSANAITVLVDAMRASGSRQYVPMLANTLAHAQVVVPKAEQVGVLHEMTGAPGFLNTYYDDEGWWALAWIDAYDLTGESQYLAMGKSIFADMSGGWDQTCGGGIWWSKDRTYKNAIANELFFSVAAHLASRAKAADERARYMDWAAREWSWFRGSGMMNGDDLVNDGLRIDATTHTCSNNQRTTWTYNQGVLIGALTEDAKTVHDAGLTQQAGRVADATLRHMTDDNGVLHEPCEPDCSGDAVQFKGILVRNLGAYAASAPEARYTAFFRSNAESVWTADQGDGGEFGVDWAGPFATASAGTQSSALDALVAEALQK